MKLSIPPKELVGDDLYIQLCWQHLYNTAEYAGLEINIDPTLVKAADNAIEMLVDGKMAVYDYSDYLNLNEEYRDYKHWFRFHYTEAYYGTSNLHSFPPMSFHDWKHYFNLERTVSSFSGKSTWFRQATYLGGGTPTDIDRVERRKLMRERLEGTEYLIEYDIIPQNEYWDRAGECGLSIHVPGSWRHSLDRGQLQMMGLGICTMSPDIWTACCGLRPQAGEHYIMLDDRFDHLDSLIHTSPLERGAIGASAKEWFQQHCTPHAIWGYVKRMMHGS